MVKKFEDVLDIINGKNQKKVKNPNGIYPIYGSGGVMGYADNYLCEANTVVIGRKGSINNPIYVEEPFWNVDTAFGLVARENMLLPRYLYFFCVHYDFGKLNTTVTIPSLTKANLLKIEINVPGIDEQKKIIDKLDSIIKLIQLQKEQIEQLDTLIKSRFVEMFDLNSYHLQPLGNCTDFIDYRGHTPELSDQGTIRMVNAKSVGKGYFKYVNEFITENTYNSWMHRGYGYSGDILFVTEGHTFGNVCQVPEDLKKFALGQRVITIKGHIAVLENTYLCMYMQMIRFFQDISAYKTGGTAQGIRSKDLAKINIPIPPIKLQKEFSNFVHRIDKLKFTKQKP